MICPMKTMKAIIVMICLCFIFFGTEGDFQMHGKCKVYDPDKPKDQLVNGKGRHCEEAYGVAVLVNGEFKTIRERRIYCLDYYCPVIDCGDTKIVKTPGKCERCKGQKGDCEWLGLIIQNGTGGPCEDGCNTCVCINGKVDYTTDIGCNLNFCTKP